MLPVIPQIPENGKPIIIVPGYSATALSVLRCLRGLKSSGSRIISCGEERGLAPALYSGIPNLTFSYSDEGFVPFLLKLRERLSDHSRPLLFLTTDRQVLDVARHRRELETKYAFMLPEKPVVELLMEKTRFYPWAQARDWPVARTETVADPAALRRLRERMPFPFVVKPYLLHAQLVRNPEELEAFMSWLTPVNYQALVAQEWIPGEDDQIYFCFLIFDRHGEVASSFVGRKLRQFPRGSGHTSLGVSVAEPEGLIAKSAALFRSLAYQGYGSLEYKFDARTGRWVIMEPTVGRFNLQIALTDAAGVNFPAALARVLEDRQAVKPAPWKPGVYWIFEYDDLKSYWRGRRNYGYIRNFLRRHISVLFSLTDPLPMIYLLWYRLKYWVRLPFKRKSRTA